MRFILIAIAFIMAVSGSALAADDASLLDRFAGEWRSDGDAFGAPAQSVMTWAPVLHGKFVQLEYHIEMQRSEDQKAVFQGVAYYATGDSDPFSAFWADNSGDLHPIKAEHENNALIAHWGVDGGKQGRTRYELLAPEKMQVTDWIKTLEGWRQFNQNDFTRMGSEE